MEDKTFENIQHIYNSKSLPDYNELICLSDSVSSVLDKEVTSYRIDNRGEISGLLDFTKEEDKPLIILPDLHARVDFLYNILQFKLPSFFIGNNKLTVYEALKQNLIRIISVGDLLHTETQGKSRWKKALTEYQNGNFTNTEIENEMSDGLRLLCILFILKINFSRNFHILKGNHENILNENGNGNYSFRKYAQEGEMVTAFMKQYYGEDVLYLISCFEKALPLLAILPKCLISHAEPERAYSRQEIIEGLGKPEIVKGLTWTENDKAKAGSVEIMLKNLLSLNKIIDEKYIGGHRPVYDNYALRQNGLFVQIHNPNRQNIVLLPKAVAFNPDKHIINIQGE